MTAVNSLPLEAMRGIGERFLALPRMRRWALGASAAWGVLVASYAAGFFSIAGGTLPRGTVFLDAMFFLVALVLPLVLIWLAVWLAEELGRQRELVAALAEVAAPMTAALAETRVALDRYGPASPQEIQKAVQGAMLGTRGPDPTGHLERLLAGQARLEAAVQRLGALAAAPRPEPPAPVAAPVQAADPETPAPPKAAEAEPLPLLPEAEAGAGPDWPDLIRALDFPRDADDREGFRALRAALRHHGLAQMLQAAEDVLNLLSQEGIFVDELTVEPADPAAWRRFIAGVRGPEVAGLGGLRDARALEVARGLTKSDSIFRDTALFFQRRFDAVLQDFAGEASDAELVEVAGTRSGRAFMLLARLSGSLD
jgi:hypothetical protein